MRIQKTDKRERRWKWLREATGESTTSGALDAATDYYLRMAGGTTHSPTGALEDLMQAAEERGSLTPEEIAEILDTPELPVVAETTWQVGGEE